MLIDWFTVLAQIINFLILVYLLKRFLYGPIVNAMDEREKKIAAALNRARDAENEARREAAEAIKEKEALAKAKESLLAEAKAEVVEWRQKALKDTRDEVAALRGRWIDLMTQEKDAFIKGLRKLVLLKVMRIGEKVLQDLAHEDIDRRVVSVFLNKLSEERDRFRPGKANGVMLLQTGFSLDEKTSDESRKKIMELFPDIQSVKFEVSDELGIGVKAMVGDNKIEWNLSNYLEGLEKEILADLSTLSGEKA
ncbi:hypothetical protein ACFL0H_12535 [Thermodesulfobacteriota bacterium]